MSCAISRSSSSATGPIPLAGQGRAPAAPRAMAELDSHPLLTTGMVAVWDVSCPGTCKHKSAEECVSATYLVFPYRGVYIRSVGRTETVGEANQVIFFNEDEPYQVSHPVEGGDSSLYISISAATLLELAPDEYLYDKSRPTFNQSRLRIDTGAQALLALLRHSLGRGMIETLEAETLILAMVRRALGKG